MSGAGHSDCIGDREGAPVAQRYVHRSLMGDVDLLSVRHRYFGRRGVHCGVMALKVCGICTGVEKIGRGGGGIYCARVWRC